MVPQGHFGYQPQAERQGHYLAIAAGSGITPMLAIISATLVTEPKSHFTFDLRQPQQPDHDVPQRPGGPEGQISAAAAAGVHL
ncbi:phenylacetic acid degradation NADH oxidoreductase paaE [Enterobacter cancerogenus]|uniref:Phenylacetic acid degradation NADH oxidoreductase paaE n=1 Tax=Enterobacter cancerogenus TaxID=69218 RepID=A0A484Z7X0_9ENTR|nr:phenylacetic acid degradation NADH oxidoreductase paaE [Enterobacter cancerogenus]